MTYLPTNINQRPTLQELAQDRMQGRREVRQAREAKSQANSARLQQEHGDVLHIFQRDICLGAKLPVGVRVDSIIHGHRISVLYAHGRSITAEHLFRVVDDSLVVPVFGGLIQRWIAEKNCTGGVREKSFDDFLDAFIWLFYDELGKEN